MCGHKKYCPTTWISRVPVSSGAGTTRANGYNLRAHSPVKSSGLTNLRCLVDFRHRYVNAALLHPAITDRPGERYDRLPNKAINTTDRYTAMSTMHNGLSKTVFRGQTMRAATLIRAVRGPARSSPRHRINSDSESQINQNRSPLNGRGQCDSYA
ncbi:hypothetical protein J6590_017732 [Homalodisca vitripennis]|nr:hypothetical protein J6590_017732 [Homalodisca vitripennis]